MGLTHYSILNNLLPNSNFTFIEPNKKLIFLLKSNINAVFFSSDCGLTKSYDFALITTPPFAHESVIQKCIDRGDKTIFVEKPFGGHSNNKIKLNGNIYVGYVLRYNPIVNWVKNNVDHSSVIEINANYFSNTIENKPTGWRNGKYSGVLNEMGSHIIDLTNYLFNIKNFEIKSSSFKSHISDVDDEVYASLISDDRAVNFCFNWVDKRVRKPIFNFVIKFKNGDKIIFDQQKVEIIDINNFSKVISVNSINEQVPYYLRGVDFTKQMQSLIGDKSRLCDLNDGYLVNNIMNKIIIK